MSINLVCMVNVFRLICRKPEDADKLMDRMQELANIKEDVDMVLNETVPQEDDEELAKLNEELDMAILGDMPSDKSSALPSVPSKVPSTTTPIKSRSTPMAVAEDELEDELNNL